MINAGSTETDADEFYQTKYGRKVSPQELYEFFIIKGAVEQTHLGIYLYPRDCTISMTGDDCKNEFNLVASAGRIKMSIQQEISYNTFDGRSSSWLFSHLIFSTN